MLKTFFHSITAIRSFSTDFIIAFFGGIGDCEVATDSSLPPLLSANDLFRLLLVIALLGAFLFADCCCLFVTVVAATTADDDDDDDEKLSPMPLIVNGDVVLSPYTRCWCPLLLFSSPVHPLLDGVFVVVDVQWLLVGVGLLRLFVKFSAPSWLILL